ATQSTTPTVASAAPPMIPTVATLPLVTASWRWLTPAVVHWFGASGRHSLSDLSYADFASTANVAPTASPPTPTPPTTSAHVRMGRHPSPPSWGCSGRVGIGAAGPASFSRMGIVTLSFGGATPSTVFGTTSSTLDGL